MLLHLTCVETRVVKICNVIPRVALRSEVTGRENQNVMSSNLSKTEIVFVSLCFQMCVFVFPKRKCAISTTLFLVIHINT